MTDPAPERSGSETPLESWKEIAAYLQRDERTARRWEKEEDLPVHRHHHLSRSSVYAYPSELDAWRANRKAPSESRRSTWWRPAPAFASTVTVALALMMAGSGPHVGAVVQAADSSDITMRRVWADKEDLETVGSPSPDGRYISFVDWSTGDLAIRDLVNGEDRRLTKKGPWEASNEYADYSLFSPSGTQVAYAWSKGPQEGELRIVGTDGSQPRVVYRGEYPLPLSWAPSGQLILAKLQNKDRILRPVIIAVADGSVRDLAIENPGRMCFSQDGAYIAYDAPQAKDARPRDVYLYELATKRTVSLVKHPADDGLLGWTPDGSHLLFSSNRLGTQDAWLVAVSRGQPQGEPRLVRKDIGDISGMGFTRSGSYYFEVAVPGHNVYTARLDLDSGKVLSPPVEAAGGYLGSNWRPDFARNGEFLAYVSERGSGAERASVIVIRSLETGEERLLKPGLRSVGFGLRWAPDGRSIFVNGADNAAREGLFRIDAQTGEAALIVERRLVGVPGLEISPDGSKIFYAAVVESGTPYDVRHFARDLQSGQEQELTRPIDTPLVPLALSPDGAQLAFVGPGDKAGSAGICVMPSSGGPPRRLVDMGTPAWASRVVAWSPDGRYLVYAVVLTKPRGTNLGQTRWELWRVPAQGGEPRRLGLTADGLLRHFRIHPDGQRVAYYAARPLKEVWVMENFLPTR